MAVGLSSVVHRRLNSVYNLRVNKRLVSGGGEREREREREREVRVGLESEREALSD